MKRPPRVRPLYVEEAIGLIVIVIGLLALFGLGAAVWLIASSL